MVVIIS